MARYPQHDERCDLADKDEALCTCGLSALYADRERLTAELAAEKEAHRVTAKDRDETLLTLGDLLLKTVAKRDRDELRAELAASEALVTALSTQRAADAVAAMRAVEEAREEQREACALAVAAAIGPCEQHRHECETDRTADAAVDAVRATPLDATPLRERIAELEAAGKVLVAANTRHFDSARENYARAESAEAERDALKADLVRLKELLRRALPSVQHYNLKALTDDILKESNHE